METVLHLLIPILATCVMGIPIYSGTTQGKMRLITSELIFMQPKELSRPKKISLTLPAPNSAK